MWVVVPVKDLASAKQRLADILTPIERARLMSNMLADVLGAVAGAGGIAELAVITNDSAVKIIAEKYGARVIPEPQGSNLCSAASHALRVLASEGIGSAAIIPADVPLLTSEIVHRLCVAHDKYRGVTLAPAMRDGGTNALALSTPQVIAPAFGTDSFRLHCGMARAVDIEPVIVMEPELSLDIDTLHDLQELLRRRVKCATQHYLFDSGIAARLRLRPEVSVGLASAMPPAHSLHRSSQ